MRYGNLVKRERARALVAELGLPGVAVAERDIAGYQPGDTVKIHAFGHWYTGRVVKVGRKRVTVRYTTGTGITRDKSVDPSVDVGSTAAGVPGPGCPLVLWLGCGHD